MSDEFVAFQRDVDGVSAPAYQALRAAGAEMTAEAREAAFAECPGLRRYDEAIERVFDEARGTVVPEGAPPAVWLVYNMGVVVKTRESLFAIDLVHRRAPELAPFLDFELVTHNHDDHFLPELYQAMDGAGKTVISNFLDNYGVRHWKKDGGYTRAVKTFKIKDVEIRTSLIDHNDYLIDFTTAFEIRVGDFILYHTGDSGRGTEPKLGTVWGKPDLWLFFPGCGINAGEAVRRVQPKRVVFGHIWELGHKHGRLTTPMVRRAKEKADAYCSNVAPALWGDRVL